ncbi:hypothetical protein M3Y94_01207800 [Aphelenchoides besseyi]|nr:hypothetical protein M3Y94_01207800 [Aphelenchoides besseyi]KAI6228499.1 hypothetical protein M3Y95_00628700 [Aphelenchoides besseyi]
MLRLPLLTILFAGLKWASANECVESVARNILRFKSTPNCLNTSATIYFSGNEPGITVKAASPTAESFNLSIGQNCTLNVNVMKAIGKSSILATGEYMSHGHPFAFRIGPFGLQGMINPFKEKHWPIFCNGSELSNNSTTPEGWSEMIVGLSMQNPIEGFEMDVYGQPDEKVTDSKSPAEVTSAFASRSIISKLLLIVGFFSFVH